MDVLCELYPVEMTAIFASKRIFAAAATGGARTAELPNITIYIIPSCRYYYLKFNKRMKENMKNSHCF